MPSEYLFSWRLSKGYLGLSDEEIDYFDRTEKEWLKQPKPSLYVLRQLFGLSLPQEAVKGTLDKEAIKEKSCIVDIYKKLHPECKIIERGSFVVAQAFCHDDARPSISISKTKGLYFCHVCGKGSDVIGLVQMSLNLAFLPALKWLDEAS